MCVLESEYHLRFSYQDTSTHNQKDNRTMTKTFTAQETIDITYDYGTSSTSKSLDDFMRLAKLKPFKSSNSIYIHSPEASDLDLTINIEAYDNDFEDATRTEKLRDAYKARAYKYIRQLFPNMIIGVVWYSGYNHHLYDIIETKEET